MRGLLDTSTKRGYRLGELLVSMGLIDELELRGMLALQAELRAHHRRRRPRTIDKHFRLGALLVQSGVIEKRVVEALVARQR